jgi:hypothetical protein
MNPNDLNNPLNPLSHNSILNPTNPLNPASPHWIGKTYESESSSNESLHLSPLLLLISLLIIVILKSLTRTGKQEDV